MTEYEAVFVDETTAYYPWQLIVDNIDPDLPVWMKAMPSTWHTDNRVSIGVDLAKERDETVFTVVEHVVDEDANTTKRIVRYVSATQDNYDKQLESLIALAKRTKASRVSIDQTGVGQVFVEEAKRKAHIEVPGCRFEGIVFTNDVKEKWATRFKGDLQLNAVALIDHPTLKRQVHGIQRTKTESNFYRFKGPRDDYFWSLMLGLYGEGRVPSRIRVLGAAA
jgi:phage FluMu gp28-like protein